MTLHQQSADPAWIRRHPIPFVPSLGRGCERAPRRASRRPIQRLVWSVSGLTANPVVDDQLTDRHIAGEVWRRSFDEILNRCASDVLTDA
jgi:hypothetical protein